MNFLGFIDLIRQEFKVERYWQVVVFYNLDFDLFQYVEDELLDIGFSLKEIDRLYYQLWSDKVKAVTCSNTDYCVSIVLFNKHGTVTDYIDSIVHEAEHIKQSMLKVYEVEDKDEPPAYTIGYLVSRMYPVFRKYVCKNC